MTKNLTRPDRREIGGSADGHASVRALTLAIVLSVLLLPTAGATAARASLVGPYFGAPFKVTKLGHAFDQAPSWAHDGKVLSGELDSRAYPDLPRRRSTAAGRSA